jgi:hypothetical protein
VVLIVIKIWVVQKYQGKIQRQYHDSCALMFGYPQVSAETGISKSTHKNTTTLKHGICYYNAGGNE